MAIKKDNRPEPARNRLRWKRVWVVGAVSLAILCGVAGLAYARYMRSLRSGVAVRAKDFYFTSNLLDEETHTLAPGTDSVTFSLGNFGDELRHSEVEISYTVTVQDESGIAVPKVDVSSGTLGKDKKEIGEVTISDLKPGTYTVTATGTGEGYTKELSAKIVVPEEAGKVYQHFEQVPGEYCVLTVWNEGNEEEKVTITYSGIPDNTNPDMADWQTGDQRQEVKIAAHESKVFRFFSGDAKAEAIGVEDKDPR